MKGQKKKKSIKKIQSSKLDVSSEQVDVVEEMPTADVVAAERAREVEYMRRLAELARAVDGSDSSSSEGDKLLLGAASRGLPAPPPPLAASASLAALADALRPAHDVRFLEEYARLLQTFPKCELQAFTDELIGNVEDVLAEDEAGDVGDAGGVVLTSWLCAAAACHLPHSLPALHRLLQQLTPPQVAEVASALHVALQPYELLAAGDAVRGVLGGRLAALLQRAALARLAGADPEWRDGALTPAEVHGALAQRWGALDAAGKLAGLALAGRVLAGAGRKEARALLAALPSIDCQDPDHLKLSAAVKTLRNLFKDK